MRIAVIGANGQLGTELVGALRAAGHEVAALTHDDLRVEDAGSVRSALAPASPEVVMNTAAEHHLPRCEADPDRTFAVNALGALHVARVSEELGAANLYVSTDYVFDGAERRPYREEDLPRPLNVYGASKAAGEQLTLAYSSRPYVVRLSGLYGRIPCRAKGESFVHKMERLARERPEVRVVDDEVLTPTPAAEAARRFLPLVTGGPPGIYHLTAGGACSWYDFAREIFDALGISTPLHRAAPGEFASEVRRPSYSVLDNVRLRGLEAVEPMPHWREGLRRFLETAFRPLGQATSTTAHLR